MNHKFGTKSITIGDSNIYYVIYVKLKAILVWLGDVKHNDGCMKSLILSTFTRYDNRHPTCKHLYGECDNDGIEELISTKLAHQFKNIELQIFVTTDMNENTINIIKASNDNKIMLINELIKEIKEYHSQIQSKN